MNMQEASRIILGLRAAGWDEKSINDFILWVETGEEQYRSATMAGMHSTRATLSLLGRFTALYLSDHILQRKQSGPE